MELVVQLVPKPKHAATARRNEVAHKRTVRVRRLIAVGIDLQVVAGGRGGKPRGCSRVVAGEHGEIGWREVELGRVAP